MYIHFFYDNKNNKIIIIIIIIIMKLNINNFSNFIVNNFIYCMDSFIIKSNN